MTKRIGVVAGILLCAGLLFSLQGASQSSDDVLIGITRVLDFHQASAAADVLTNRWFAAEPFGFSRISATTLLGGNSIPGAGTFEARRRGLTTQLARIIATGDLVVGGQLAGSEQAYADAAATFTSFPLERRYVWAMAAILGASAGFAIVPGGPAEALNRIVTCLNGNLVSNEGAVAGVNLDCSTEVIRRALADLIAPGFFVGFGRNPAIADKLSCAALEENANGGLNAEFRWAFGKAYVLNEDCTPRTAEGYSAVAGDLSNSYELRQAAVAKLVEVGGSGGLGVGATNEERLANAWNAGLLDEKTISLTSDCRLINQSNSDVIDTSALLLGAPEGWSVVASFARFYLSAGGNCGALSLDNSELQLTIQGRPGDGSTLPLMSFAVTQ